MAIYESALYHEKLWCAYELKDEKGRYDEEFRLQMRMESQRLQFSCPECKEKMMLCAGPLVEPYFRHYSDVDCPRGALAGNGKQMMARRMLYGMLRRSFRDAEIEPEARLRLSNGDDWEDTDPEDSYEQDLTEDGFATRALIMPVDFLVTLPSGEQLAVFYLSREKKLADWEEKHMILQSVGIEDVWFLDANYFYTKDPTTFEYLISKYYDERFYLDMNQSEIVIKEEINFHRELEKRQGAAGEEAKFPDMADGNSQRASGATSTFSDSTDHGLQDVTNEPTAATYGRLSSAELMQLDDRIFDLDHIQKEADEQRHQQELVRKRNGQSDNFFDRSGKSDALSSQDRTDQDIKKKKLVYRGPLLSFYLNTDGTERSPYQEYRKKFIKEQTAEVEKEIRQEELHMHDVQAKHLLSVHNGMNVYRGCSHGCIYCDSRSTCYQMKHDFEDIEVKINAPELLEQELRKKRQPCMVGTGAMCDPYLHIEEKLGLTRRCLEIIEENNCGVAIQTKSARILRDLDLLKRINEKTKTVVQITITTMDDDLCKIVEPNVSVTSERFEVLRIMQENNIPTVVWMTPQLPFINDTVENITAILEKCGQLGVYGIMNMGMGLTLRDGDRQYYYQKLDEYFPGKKERYMARYGNDYELPSPNEKELYETFYRICRKYGMESNPDRLFRYFKEFESKLDAEQISLFDTLF